MHPTVYLPTPLILLLFLISMCLKAREVRGNFLKAINPSTSLSLLYPKVSHILIFSSVFLLEDAKGFKSESSVGLLPVVKTQPSKMVLCLTSNI